jgi:predicted  nucleic acid-binding Zn-ribbon protein
MATRKTTKKAEAAVAAPVKKPTPVVRTIEKGESNTIEDKLRALYQLQLIDSQVDRIRITRGELPMEVADLEDEIAGLQTRINNYGEEFKAVEEQIKNRKNTIKDAQALIKKYQSQQGSVKNNREFDSLNKEIEYQQLEIQLCEKRIKEYTVDLNEKKLILEASEKTLEGRNQDLQNKKDELDSIIAETEKEEAELTKESNKASDVIEERLLTAYHRLRKNARNGVGVVSITRDACGGCFNKIPPQRQLDIRQRKKVIVCEHCGRILVDAGILDKD